MKQYKYIHFLWANETKFNIPIAKIVSQKELSPESSLIVTPHLEVYEAIKDYGNVVLDQDKRNLFNKYYSHGDWLFSHGFPKSFNRYFIYPWVKRRIVYRYWGGRRCFNYKDRSHYFYNSFLWIYKLAYDCLFRFFYDGMALIGTNGLVDDIDLSSLIKKSKLMFMPVGRGGNPLLPLPPPNNNEKLHILIGHRSDRIFKHIFYIELLKKFNQDLYEIYIPIAYGDAKYAKELKQYVRDNNLKNILFLENLIPPVDYRSYLSSMDVALFDCDNSIASGNIATLLNMEKTIFLSRTGVLKKAFDHEKIPHHCLDEIQFMDFKQFSTPLHFSRDSLGDFRSKTFSEYIQAWVKIYRYLDSIDS